MRADLDTLLIAVYCAACSLFPSPPEACRRRGRPRTITDNELICLMVAQMLLGIDSERRFLSIAGWRLRHLFPRRADYKAGSPRDRPLEPGRPVFASFRLASPVWSNGARRVVFRPVTERIPAHEERRASGPAFSRREVMGLRVLRFPRRRLAVDEGRDLGRELVL